MARRRYARRISSAEAPGDRPSVRYGSGSLATIEVWRRSPGCAGPAFVVPAVPSAGPQQLPEWRQVEARDRLGADATVRVVDRRPVIAGQHPERLAVQHAGLD